LAVDAFGKTEDRVGVDVASEAKDGVTVNTSVFEIDACAAVLADDDLHLIVPAVGASADLDTFDNVTGTAEHITTECSA